MLCTRMADKPDKDVPKEPVPAKPPASEADQLEKLAGLANATGLPRGKASPPETGSQSPSVPLVAPQVASPKASLTQILVLLNTVVVLFLVGVMALMFTYSPEEAELGEAAPGQSAALPPAASGPADAASGPASADLPTHQEPVTWDQAERLYKEGQYEACQPLYRKLTAMAQAVPSQALVADFFRLRMAQCDFELGLKTAAQELFAGLSGSSSPAVAAVAGYCRARMALDQQHYHSARLYAYQAIAALGCLDVQPALESDCDYLIAMALTRQALAFGNLDLPLDEKAYRPNDPFDDLRRQDLQSCLKEGADRLKSSSLGPAIWRLEDGQIGRRWVAGCSLAPLEEMLQRFASQAGLDVQWDEAPPAVRQRAVSLCLQGVSEQRLVEVACGVAGLTARYTGQTVVVHDLQTPVSLTRQRELLTQTAIMAWRRFGLRYPDDPRVGKSHFAMAGLLDSSGESAAALSSYQVLAQRYPHDSLAPLALLQSAMLRLRLRDYSGARTDLLDLLDRYPSGPSFEQVYLRLGQATHQAGMIEEAARVYSRLYHLDVSVPTKRQACLGAAQCHFDQKDYPQTIEWVKRYRELADQDGGRELAAAYVVWAQAANAQGDVEQARQCFSAALAAGPSRQHYVSCLLEMARLDLQQGRMAQVLGALARLEELPLDQEQLFSMLVLSAHAHRAMGLAPVAIRMLRGRIAGLVDPVLRARLQVEYATCLRDDNDAEGACAALEEAMPSLPPGPPTDAAWCDLAELHLKAGRAEQAVTLAEQILARPTDPQQRRRAMEILGAAYLQRRQYPQAAQAFSGLVASRQEGQAQP